MEDKKIIYCKRCHRKLKDEKAIKLGYGPVCFSKIHKNQSLFLFEVGVNNEVMEENK